MKKLFSVILALIMALSCFCVLASANNEPLKLIAASDIHYQKAPASLPKYNNSPLYHYAAAKGNLYPESAAIFDEFLKQAASSEAQFILLSGDLVNNASLDEHTYISGKLADFEATTSKKVFVINGNNDISASFTRENFKTSYAAFAYDEALSVDSASCSYTAELDGDYRLLAIDSCIIGQSAGTISAQTLSWIKEQAQQADADGKALIAMMHHGLMQHIPLQSFFLENYYINNSEEVIKLFSEYGIKIVFTGHFHINDSAQYRTDNNDLVYDIATGSLTSNTCSYREVSFTKKSIAFKSAEIDSIDIAEIEYLYSPEQSALIKSDFSAYAKGFYKAGTENLIKSYINADKLNARLKAQEGSVLNRVINALTAAVDEFFEIPLYSETETDISVQNIASRYNISIPESQYTSYSDILTEYVAAVTAGDESFGRNSLEFSVAYSASSALLRYAFNDFSADEIKTALVQIVNNLLSQTASSLINNLNISVSKDEMTDFLLRFLFEYYISDFGTDDSPADNNFELTNTYFTEINPFIAFIEKIIEFFRKIINFMKSVFVR